MPTKSKLEITMQLTTQVSRCISSLCQQTGSKSF